MAPNMPQSIAEVIWDFLFLEGNVAIFRAILATFSILEPYLMELNEFNDLYQILNTITEELLENESNFIKHMFKFSNIKQHHINKLREKFSPEVMKDQNEVWVANSRAASPQPNDSVLFKRVKLLNKFFLLNIALSDSKCKAVLDMKDENLNIEKYISCNPEWPLCLYDFTVRSKVANYFCMKVGKPVKIIHDYFGPHEDIYDDIMMDVDYIL